MQALQVSTGHPRFHPSASEDKKTRRLERNTAGGLPASALLAFFGFGIRLQIHASPGSGITFSGGATTVPLSKSRAVGVSVRLYHGLFSFFVKSDQRTI